VNSNNKYIRCTAKQKNPLIQVILSISSSLGIK